MARKTETREIGQHRFRVTQFKVRKANRILEQIIHLIGPALGVAADNLGETDPEKVLKGDLAKGALADAAAKLVIGLDGDQLNWLIDESIPAIEYQTPELRAAQPDVFVPMSGELWDNVFAGRLMDQFALMAFVAELNFGSFFVGVDGIKSAVHRFVTPTTSTSRSPQTETTGSGVSSSPTA